MFNPGICRIWMGNTLCTHQFVILNLQFILNLISFLYGCTSYIFKVSISRSLGSKVQHILELWAWYILRFTHFIFQQV